MILIFEPTPFARSKSLANGVGLFYKDKLHIFTLLMSLTIYDIMSIFLYRGVFGYNFHLYSHISTSRLYASAPSTYSVLISSNESLGDRITPSLPNLLK